MALTVTTLFPRLLSESRASTNPTDIQQSMARYRSHSQRPPQALLNYFAWARQTLLTPLKNAWPLINENMFSNWQPLQLNLVDLKAFLIKVLWNCSYLPALPGWWKPLGVLVSIWGTTTVIIRRSRSLPALTLISRWVPRGWRWSKTRGSRRPMYRF